MTSTSIGSHGHNRLTLKVEEEVEFVVGAATVVLSGQKPEQVTHGGLRGRGVTVREGCDGGREGGDGGREWGCAETRNKESY